MDPADTIAIRPITPADRAWVEEVLVTSWGDTAIVTRGRVHQAAELPGFIAVWEGRPIGLVTYRYEQDACEVISLDSLTQNRGVGSKLLAMVEKAAASQGIARIWLITTNDNMRALRFYQRRDYRIVAVHAGAIAESRRIKPSIPRVGQHGIPLRDEIELAKPLSEADA